MFQDCEVGPWEPEECSAECAGGTEVIKRKILTPAKAGAGCLPLEDIQNCNMHPCPVDCEKSELSEWSKCSAECGGGVQQRLKTVTQAMKYGGKQCGETSESRSC